MNEYDAKKVLLAMPFYYGYEHEIENALIKIGYKVRSYFFTRYQKKFTSFLKSEEKYIHKIKKEIIKITEKEIFDYLLVINSSYIDTEIIHSLRENNNKIKSIIYLWDPIENLKWKDFDRYISNYDYRYSFDHRDCLEYLNLNIKHRPNFYHPYLDRIKNITNPKYDIATIMSAQPERIRIINDLDKNYPKLNRYFYIYFASLKSVPVYFINHSLIVKPKQIKIKRLGILDSLNILNNSKCILDIVYFNQYGFPFRTLDAIGLQRKLITTNKDIMLYEFYDPDNIYIIQSGITDGITDFLLRPYKPVKDEIRIKYSIDFWVKALLSNENINYLKSF
jgi:hypothetical protein